MSLFIMTSYIPIFLLQVTATESPVELFSDISFQQGFTVTAASHPAPKVDLGVLQTTVPPSTQPPAWRIAQWASRFLLEPGAFTDIGGNQWSAETPGKQLLITRLPDGQTQLRLAAHGIREYNGHLRQPGEAWPHLLIEQGFSKPIRLTDLKTLVFNLAMRVPQCTVDPACVDKINPGLHTAQTSVFWTVHNMTEGSPDNHDMIWFGIPLFDARYDVPPPHYALDGGKEDASGKFICLLDGKRFWTGKTGDGEWRSLSANLSELIREGLAITQEHGHLKNTTPDDLYITSMNLGWELPGPYDAALEIRGLSLQGTPK